MRRLSLIAVALLFVSAFQRATPPPTGTGPLWEMAETEREFARTAIKMGIRDSFLEFFAPDAIALTPEPHSAVERLRGRPSRPFSEAELTWQPRAGDVAASGELGWLTGPSTYTDHVAKAAPSYGNYLSVWRRQRNGVWRVYIDIGTTIPMPAPFAPGFTQVRLSRTYVGGRSESPTSPVEADKALNARIASDGTPTAYDAALGVAARLHRPNVMPQVGRPVIVAWLEKNALRWSWQTTAGEAAKSADLGYSYGLYAAGEKKGGYVRIWDRDADGKWWLMAEVVTE